MVEPINWSLINSSVFNITSYPAILNFTNMSNPLAFFSTVNSVWIHAMGNWFYSFLIFLTCGVVYIKTRSIFPTALTLLLLSATMIAVLPNEVGMVMYLAMVLAVFVVLWALIADERW